MRPSILYPLFSSIETINGIGAKYTKMISNLCGNKVVDLLFHFPYNTVDRTYSPPLSLAKSGRIWTGIVEIVEHIPPSSKRHPYKIHCICDNTEITLIFFKVYKDYIQKSYPVGSKRAISGKLEYFNHCYQMSHPEYVVSPENFSHIAIHEPVYPLTYGVTNKMMCNIQKEAIKRLPVFKEWQKDIPSISFNDAIYRLHNPQSIADLLPSSEVYSRLAYDELLSNQLALAFIRHKSKQQAGNSYICDNKLYNKIKSSLPFELTSSQEDVLTEISKDQSSPYQMLRLLQGDVGSGKTVVAFLSMLKVIENGFQTALMAPTEILAKQHYESFTLMCQDTNIKVSLLLGKTKAKARKEILADLAQGKIDILIGTHALFTDSVVFKNLGYVVIDEQHRFGVNQRLALSSKGKSCDVLVMTATPIPRSLLLTSYGDMDYSKITEMPKSRKPTTTVVMHSDKIPDVIAGISRKLQDNARVYWVCPLVEESEKSDLAAATMRYEMLQKKFGDKVGLIHGKQKEKEKDAVMDSFKKGDISLLVSTTVIEVGVNVPEATVMIIEQSERFGLSQLHQLRGRIKRGNQAGTCILLYSYPISAVAKERLSIMKKTEDGFYIAQRDLELRGGGELLGTRQSGFTQFKIADMSVHQDLLLKAKADAEGILKTDILLESKRGQSLRNLLYLFSQDEAVKSYLAG